MPLMCEPNKANVLDNDLAKMAQPGRESMTAFSAARFELASSAVAALAFNLNSSACSELSVPCCRQVRQFGAVVSRGGRPSQARCTRTPLRRLWSQKPELSKRTLQVVDELDGRRLAQGFPRHLWT